MKIIDRNKKYLLIFLPLFVLNVWFFTLLYTLSKIPYHALTCGFETDSIASHVYFVHGYNGNDSQFQDMIDFLNKTNFFERSPTMNVTPHFFNYYERYYNLKMTKAEIHNIQGGISTYAKDFYEQLRDSHTVVPTYIDIVAHSLGGLITREMLRIYRDKLKTQGIYISRVITLGTPHLGTELINHPVTERIMWFLGFDCNTLIGRSLTPGSAFLSQLNQNASYMDNIAWYFVAGVALNPLAVIVQETIFNGIPCDGLVDCESALGIGLGHKANRIILQKDHEQLICDPQNQESYKYINKCLSSVV